MIDIINIIKTLEKISSHLISSHLHFKLFKILCLLINYKNYYIYFEFIFDKIVYSIKCFYSYFYIQNIFGKNKNKYHYMILVICYNIINLKNAIDKAKE